MLRSHLLRGNIHIKKSSIAGYGVFADQDFQPGDVIEECYTIMFPKREVLEPGLANYYYGNGEMIFVPLGSGCIFNHSDNPNAGYEFHIDRSLAVFTAERFIKRGEEIFIYYGDNWFNNRDMKIRVPLRDRIMEKFRPVMLPLKALLVISAILGLIWVMK